MLEYLITSYIYSAYPDLKPGQMTDLRSIAINNTTLAIVAIRRALHKHLIKNSNPLTIAISNFERYVGTVPAKVNPRLIKKECRRIMMMLKIMSFIDKGMIPDMSVAKDAVAFFNKNKRF